MVMLLAADALDEALAIDEDGVAAVAGARTMTWSELDAYASALAIALERRGVRPGEHVAMLAQGLDAIVAFWAIARASAVGVALDTNDTGELASALRDLDARALLIDASLAPTFHHAIARSPNVRAVIARGHARDEHAGTAVYVAWEDALAEDDVPSRGSLLPTHRIDLDPAWLERDTHAQMGSVRALSHRVLLARASSVARGFDLAEDDDVSGTAFAETAIACALSGACMRAWPGDAVRAEGREEGRSLFFLGDDEEADAPAAAEEVVLYRHPVCGPIAVVSGENEPARVLPNVDVRIIDEKGLPTPAKVVGEITVRSSSTLTAARTVEYVKTGDSGMLDEGGGLYVL